MSHKLYNTVVELRRDGQRHLFYCTAMDPRAEDIVYGELHVNVFRACHAEHGMRQLTADCDVELIESFVKLTRGQKDNIIVKPLTDGRAMQGTNFPTVDLILDENTFINYLRYDVTSRSHASHASHASHQPSPHASHQPSPHASRASHASRQSSHQPSRSHASHASRASHASHASHVDSDEVGSPLGGGAVDVDEIVDDRSYLDAIQMMLEGVVHQQEGISGKVDTGARLTAQLGSRQAQLQNVSMLPSSQTLPPRANENHLIAQTYMFMMHGGTFSDIHAQIRTEFEKIDYYSPMGSCPTIADAAMLTGFSTSQQMMDNIEYFLHGREQCHADGKHAMLQPIAFTIGNPTDPHVPYIGLYRYDFIGKIPANDGIQAIKAAVRDIRVTKLVSFPQLDPTKVYTYTNLFKMVSADVETLLRPGQVINPKAFHIIFFCCRQHSRNIQFPMYREVDSMIMAPVDFANFARKPQAGTNIQLLEVTMPNRPPMPTLQYGPLGTFYRDHTHLTEQSCLLNLLAFYGFIPYDLANVMALMMGPQQRTSLSTRRIITAGESVRFFMHAIDEFLPQVNRSFIVERMSTTEGLQKIMNNMRKIAAMNTRLHYAWFVKFYTINIKPGTSDVFSEMGHWISFWLDAGGNMNYVDPQGIAMQTGGDRMSFAQMPHAGDNVAAYPLLAALIATYQVVDIIYVVTGTPPQGGSHLTGILYTVGEISAPRLPKGGRRTKKHKAARN